MTIKKDVISYNLNKAEKKIKINITHLNLMKMFIII